MGLWELFLIGVGLSMDAFAVSVCKGLSVQKLKAKNILIVGAYFGGFQALMPLIGYFVGSRFETLITSIDHWIVFILLSIIGVNMIRESREEEKLDDDFGFKKMISLAVATSIDALAVGISFAASKNCTCCLSYRSNNIHTFRNRNKGRECFRFKVQVCFRSYRWCNTYTHRNKDTYRTPVFQVIFKIL